MGRSIGFELVTDTSYFTPLQMQPRTLLATSFQALSRWLKEHLVSFPELIRRHSTSVVILGTRIDYGAPFTFFDGDSLHVEAALRVLRAGSRAQLDCDFSYKNKSIATVQILLCPVRIVDPLALGAEPAPFEPKVLERFRPDEIDPGSPERRLPPLKEALAQRTPLGIHSSPFVVHRHLCEVADQWAFFEVAGLVGASREAMARGKLGRASSLLRAHLGQPLRHFDMELSRPYFWFQMGKVETTAFVEERPTFLHRLLSPVPGGEFHGIVIERF